MVSRRMSPVDGSPIPVVGNADYRNSDWPARPAASALRRKAGLQSHTVRNRSKQHIPEPVEDFVIDVRQQPGINIPDPVQSIEYKEQHPVIRQW